MTDEKAPPFHNPFAVLGGLHGARPDEPAESKPEPAPAPVEGTGKRIPRAVVRYERSGRGGKEVTVVEHLLIDAAERGPWLRELKAALGCGGSVEGQTLVLQGDQRERLPKLLTARGVKRVTIA